MTQIDSSGISIIVKTIRSLRGQGCDLRLLCRSGHLLEVLWALHLLQLIPSLEDEKLAASLGRGRAPVVAHHVELAPCATKWGLTKEFTGNLTSQAVRCLVVADAALLRYDTPTCKRSDTASISQFCRLRLRFSGWRGTLTFLLRS